MNNRTLAILPFIFSTISVLAATSTLEVSEGMESIEQCSDALAKGDQSYEEAQFDRSKEEYLSILKSNQASNRCIRAAYEALVYACMMLGDDAQFAGCAESLLKEARSKGVLDSKVWALSPRLSTVYISSGQITLVEEHWKELLVLAEEGSGRPSISAEVRAVVYGKLGTFAKLRGEFEQARDFFVQSLALSSHESSGLLAMPVLMDLGELYADSGEIGEAKKLFEKAVSASVQLFGRNSDSTLAAVERYAVILREADDSDRLSEVESLAESIRGSIER